MRHKVGRALGLGLKEDLLAAPDLLEVVVVADVGLQGVDNDRSEVDEHPLARVAALDAEDLAAGLLDGGGDGVREGAGLAARRARGDDHALELIGERLGVEDLDVTGLDVLEGVHGGFDKLIEFHCGFCLIGVCLTNSVRSAQRAP